MTTPSRKYDVAVSFLYADEALALDLASRLSPEFNVFIFSKKQEELAGSNGLETLREVFLKESSLVVVLYRDGWGQSP